MTSKPTKAARTKIVISIIRVITNRLLLGFASVGGSRYSLLGSLVDDLAVLGEQGAGDDLVLGVDLEVALVVDEELDQVLKVLGVEGRGVAGHLARQVGRADDLDAVHL